MATAAAGALAAALLVAVPASAADYPSWEDIAAAKGDASAKQAQVSELERHLADLQSEAGELGNAAVDASSRYDVLRSELEASDARLGELAAARSAAAAEAASLNSQVGALAAQTYKTGGMDSSLLFILDAEAGTAHFDRLATLQLVTDRTARLFEQAAAAESTAASLQEAEEAERQARETLAHEAGELYEGAEAATAAAEQAVREQEERTAELVAQLAELKDSTAEAELKRLEAARVEESVRQQAEAARLAAVKTPRPENQPVINPTIPRGPEPGPVPPPVPPAPAPAPAPAPVPVPPLTGNPAPLPVAPPPPAAPVDDPAGAQAYAAGASSAYGWDGSQFRCLVDLWNRESNWRTSAHNPYSGAYGIPQSLPGDKMAALGSDWRTNYRTQINWGLMYISQRYGSPCAAWDHSERVNWY
ncbi:coiled-coil domain-containing protein [Arthrobacter sp. 7Tela_A1]|uniref:coiled-coil domain-containing protein n=1 Tax=Arthrobacter sp. 7Tela_A1 TaxID=3093745 RepID=UPI003BB64467